MEKNLILKIAAGVFIGMAAWTNRAELGSIAFYGVMILITLFVIMYLYSSITTPIKDYISERQVGVLVAELNKQGLLEGRLVGAAREGLKRFNYESTRNELSELLDSIKKKRGFKQVCNVEEQRIAELLSEIVNDFKQTYREN